MPEQELVRGRLEIPTAEGGCVSDAIEDRRRYNREFMRRWRADPFRLAAEQARRRERYYGGQKQRRIERAASSPHARERDKKLCGFCWKRPALKKIVRLQVSESAPDGYVKVRIPYCGEC